MTDKKKNSPASGAKWALIGGLAALAVAGVVWLLVFSGRGGGPEASDPAVRESLAGKQLAQKVKELTDAGQYAAAAGEIESFLNEYPDSPNAASLWALKIVCHRKGGDLGGALLSVAAMADKFQGRGKDLCAAGAVLVGRDCFQDAAKVFELASVDADVRVRACYQAAICNYRLGRYGAAMQYIDVVAALKPNDPEVKAAVKRVEDARFANGR